MHPDLTEIWQAFQNLHYSRTAGFEVNPIQVSEIESWLRIHEVTELEDRIEYFQLITALDQVWIKWSRDKRKEDKSGNVKTRNRRKKANT